MPELQSQTPAGRLAAAWQRFDEENAKDPNVALVHGVPTPRELAYARWLTEWVFKLDANPPEELQLAARCQHLCRWKVPRNSYPMTRAGYLTWREHLKKFHASTAAEILRETGYPSEMIAQVQALILKQNFPADPMSRVLEDALCLVFLERQFSELAGKTPDDKMLVILQKSWNKMSATGRARALELPYSEHERRLLNRLA